MRSIPSHPGNVERSMWSYTESNSQVPTIYSLIVFCWLIALLAGRTIPRQRNAKVVIPRVLLRFIVFIVLWSILENFVKPTNHLLRGFLVSLGGRGNVFGQRSLYCSPIWCPRDLPLAPHFFRPVPVSGESLRDQNRSRNSATAERSFIVSSGGYDDFSFNDPLRDLLRRCRLHRPSV